MKKQWFHCVGLWKYFPTKLFSSLLEHLMTSSMIYGPNHRNQPLKLKFGTFPDRSYKFSSSDRPGSEKWKNAKIDRKLVYDLSDLRKINFAFKIGPFGTLWSHKNLVPLFFPILFLKIFFFQVTQSVECDMILKARKVAQTPCTWSRNTKKNLLLWKFSVKESKSDIPLIDCLQLQQKKILEKLSPTSCWLYVNWTAIWKKLEFVINLRKYPSFGGRQKYFEIGKWIIGTLT